MRVGRCLLVLLALALSACSINIESADSPEPDAPAGVVQSSGPGGSPELKQVIGSGNVNSESRQVSGFDRITFSGSGELLIEQTGTESLTIEAEDNILPLLRAEVENGQLILGLRPGTGFVSHKPIIFRLTVNQLTALTSSGSGSTQITRLDNALFKLQGNGSTEVSAAGRADHLEVALSGSGGFNGESLMSKSARVEISGSSDVVVNASDSLDVQISGSGSVNYLGNPQLNKRVSGSGQVEKR